MTTNINPLIDLAFDQSIKQAQDKLTSLKQGFYAQVLAAAKALGTSDSFFEAHNQVRDLAKERHENLSPTYSNAASVINRAFRSFKAHEGQMVHINDNVDWRVSSNPQDWQSFAQVRTVLARLNSVVKPVDDLLRRLEKQVKAMDEQVAIDFLSELLASLVD